MDKEVLIDILGGKTPSEEELKFIVNHSKHIEKKFFRGMPLYYGLIAEGHVIKEYGLISHWTDDVNMAMWFADIESSNEGCPDMDIVESLEIADEDIPRMFKPLIMVANGLTGFDAHAYLSGHENPFDREREFITTGKAFVIESLRQDLINGKVFFFATVKEHDSNGI